MAALFECCGAARSLLARARADVCGQTEAPNTARVRTLALITTRLYHRVQELYCAGVASSWTAHEPVSASYHNSIWLKGGLRVHRGKVDMLVPCRDSCPRCACILVGPRSQCFPAQQRRTSSLRFLQNPAALTVRQHRRMQYTCTAHRR